MGIDRWSTWKGKEWRQVWGWKGRVGIDRRGRGGEGRGKW